MRLKIIRVATICLWFFILATLFYMQAARGKYYFDLSMNNRIRVVPLEGWRGRIFDRNGVVLADSRLSYNAMVIPQDIKNFQELFGFLSQVLEVDKNSLIKQYQQRRQALFIPVVVAEDIPRAKAIILEENKFRFPSLLLQESFKRFYPLNTNSAHVLGYVGKINRAQIERLKEYGYSPQSLVGYTGVEEYYDANLRGQPGGLQVEVNSSGQQVRLLSLKEPQRGDDISLTIDTRIQQISTELLMGKEGVVAMMDIHSGEILALVSSPGYNPNSPSETAGGRGAFLNRAVQGVYPPGSVFKVPEALCGLSNQKITENTNFYCNGFLDLGGIKFGCTAHHGDQNLMAALTHSCNVYFYNVGRILGEEKISSCANTFGLGTLTHIDLPYEVEGIIPNLRQRALAKNQRWYAGDTLNLSIGQGDVLVTPVQLMRMMSTVARDGAEVQPHVIKAIGQVPVERYAVEHYIKMEEKYFNIVQRAMRASVTDFAGTAHGIDIDGLYVAGKTGTAQTSGQQNTHAWFVGYTKDTKPEIVFCVFLEHGGSSHNAVSLARELLLRMQEEKIL